jgi:predicted nuclease with TOPRIM domain
MLRSDSNSMSNDLNQLLERKNKLEEELNTKLSADYTELMKKVSEGFHGMQVSAVEYYKQKANEEMDKMEKNIKSGNKFNAINEKLLADTYLSLATTL